MHVIAAFPNRGLPGLVKGHAAEYFPGIDFDWRPADGPGADVMPKMFGDLAYDVCDVSPSSLLIAAERGIPVAGLPVITSTDVPLGELIVNRSAIATPADLAGKRIGVRTWTNPVKPWLAGILTHDFGVDLSRVQWVATVRDPLPGVALPPNASRVEGRTLLELLESGEIDAAISPGPVKLDGFGPLFQAASGAGQAWLARSGTLPVMHLPTVRRSLVTDQPGAAEALVAGFAAGKTRYLAGLPEIARNGTDDPMARRDAALQTEYGVDPIPLGLDVFRTSFERLGTYMVEQGYLQSQPVIDELFVADPPR